MSRLSGPEQAIVDLLRLLRGRPQGNQIDVQQTIAPAEVYAQALAAVIAAWTSAGSTILTGPQTNYVVNAGLIEFEIWNGAAGAQDLTVQVYISAALGWRTVYTYTLGGTSGTSSAQFISDGTNMRFSMPAGMAVRIMRITS